MDTAEHIVETYIRYVKRWFTISNIKCKSGNEIDVLAIDTKNNKKYHIEVSVHITGAFRKLSSKELEKGKSDEALRKRTLKFFIESKFNNLKIKDTLKEFGFLEGNYDKVIVTWDVEKSENMDRLLSENNIKVWKIGDLLNEMITKIDTKFYSDDIIRTLQFLKLSDK